MNYSQLIGCDVNNAIGFSVTLFVSGCGKNPKCKGCHNSIAWDFNYGEPYTQETEDKIIKALSNPHIGTLSILGGEPMDNLSGGELLKLVRRVRRELPDKKIFCWTGYLYENLIKDEQRLEFIKELDFLRDGEYIPELRNLNQRFQGSTNQRSIDVKQSLMKGEVIEYGVENIK